MNPTLRAVLLLAGMFGAGFVSGSWSTARDPAPAAVAPPSAPAGADRSAPADQDAPLADPALAAVDESPSLGPEPAAATRALAAAEGLRMPEPPASWMTIEQQRVAAEAYREWVRETSRLAGERIRDLNAELYLIEGQDPAWGATMESRVRGSLAGSTVFAGAELEGIECRVTVCRATVRFSTADSPRALLQGGRSPWSEWRNAQIIPLRAEVGDGVPGFRATVYLREDFDQQRLPRGPRAAGPGGP